MEETLFTKIINGEIASTKIYEDEHTFAFLTIDPINKGHTLVIPKTQYKDITEVEEKDYKPLMKTIVKVAKAVKSGTNAPGVNVHNNNGKEAGQEIFHLHFHIIPRFNKKELPPVKNKNYKNEAEREEIANNIIKFLKN